MSEIAFCLQSFLLPQKEDEKVNKMYEFAQSKTVCNILKKCL